MDICILNNGNIYTNPYNKNYIKCFTEYGLKYININIHKLENTIKISKELDTIILIPFTHINNIWHLIHSLFILFKYIKKNNLNIDEMYPIFFDNFIHRQGNLLDMHYKDLIFEGMGFSYDLFKEKYNIFLNKEAIKVNKNIYVSTDSINFNNEPLFQDFKKYIINNFKLIYSNNYINNKKNITFILRRGTREITNINFVKEELKQYNINYIYLEDYDVKEQINICLNSNIIIGVHGAGLTWSIFMNSNSLLIELYPGNSNTDNYIRFCNIAKINYKRLSVNITKGNVNEFRSATVNLNKQHINKIKQMI